MVIKYKISNLLQAPVIIRIPCLLGKTSLNSSRPDGLTSDQWPGVLPWHHDRSLLSVPERLRESVAWWPGVARVWISRGDCSSPWSWLTAAPGSRAGPAPTAPRPGQASPLILTFSRQELQLLLCSCGLSVLSQWRRDQRPPSLQISLCQYFYVFVLQREF